jgi:hypothetical protein
MSNENTKDLSADEALKQILSRQDLILAELADLRLWREGVDARLVKIEAFVDDRLRDTQPLLGKIHKEVADTRADIGDIKRELRLLREDLWNERKERIEIAERVSQLEMRPAA